MQTSAKPALLLSIAMLQACVVVPRTDAVYDHECKILRRQMTLEVQQIGAFGGCANDGCVALLVGAGVVAVASAVVSSSIAVVGNVVYWAERQGQCVRPTARVPGPPGVAASAP